ncbi:MAG: thioredoxin [Candidatus Kapabacteria bacterium]|nr:thioredoxin [Ignavibacteriota bacterium]MCW5884391.1 thioredoxin [Candidatus Kapabacteria bacterium]
MNFLSKQEFIEKVFDFENKTEWEYVGERPVIIDFYADWCGPCKMLSPIMEELSNEYSGKVDIFKVDTEQEQELAGAFGIRSIPSVLFIPKNSERPQMSVGAMRKEDYKKAINDIFGVAEPIAVN